MINNHFAQLHCHSEYSNLRMLDSTNKLTKMIDYVTRQGFSGLAITDHESLSGHIKALRYVQEQKKEGKIAKDFRLALGNEIYLIDSIDEVQNHYVKGHTFFYHFILIAKDKEGHRQLRQLSSKAWENRFVQFKMERVPIEKRQVEEIIGNNKGHLIASTACLGGELPHAILNNDYQRAGELINWCCNTFGQDNFYLEMQPNASEDQQRVNTAITKIATQIGGQCIITCDAHYLTKEHRPIHEAYLNSRDDESREIAEFYESCYFMEADEIHKRMDSYLGSEIVDLALQTTNHIMSQIEEYDLYHDQVVPKVAIPEFQVLGIFSAYYNRYPYLKKFAESDDAHDRYYLYLVEKGFLEKERIDGSTTPIGKQNEDEDKISRINDELEAIWESSEKIHDKISNYYITYKSIKDMVWDDGEDGGNSLVGVGRGSVAAFYTAYLIGIQDVNSYKFNIPYWRHLHKDRPEMPDVDADSETRQRSRIIQATKKKFGENKVLNICAFKTEGSKSAILTVCRGLGIDHDVASYLANMIPVKRGFTASLDVMVNGNSEEDIEPDKQFIAECNKYPHLLDYALEIAGIISGRTIHASGVIIFEDDYNELNCMMTSPNGQPTTQWEMNDSTYCGGLKYDFLTVTNLDVMHVCLDFLVQNGYIEWQGNLRKTFEKYFSPDVLNYDDISMWKKAWNGEIMNLFQFDTDVGGQTIKKTEPRNLTELGVANSLERLQAQEGDTEQPTDRYVRYKNDEQQWYQCMQKYGLNEDEVSIIEKYLKNVHGVATMQEEVMLLVMDPQISNFSMVDANKLRKSIAKKNKKLQKEAIEKFYKKGKEVGSRNNILDYVWNECIRPQLGYSFSLPHVISYSIIAVQEANMAHFYPAIFWQCANLIINSGSDEENLGETTEYGKVGEAITNIREQGVIIEPPDINRSSFGFVPLVKDNAILYGLKPINGIGDNTASLILQNRPFVSYQDFYQRMIETGLIKPSEMVVLIKSKALNNLCDEDELTIMKEYLRTLFTPADRLTMSQMNRIITYGLIQPQDEIYLNYRMINFRNYVLDESRCYKEVIIPDKKLPKCGYHDRLFILDDKSQKFFQEYFSEDSVEEVISAHYVISEKKFSKEVDKRYIEPLGIYINQSWFVDSYNQMQEQQLWDKYCQGLPEHLSFDALSYYPDNHELIRLDKEQLGVTNYFEKPTTPEPYSHYYRWIDKEQKVFDKYKIERIAGTVLDRNNTKHTLTLLTPDGIVKVKFSKGEYIFYSRTLSEIDEKTGRKVTLEPSWFKRGTLLLVAGYRQDEVWRAKVYSDSVYKHTVNRIVQITDKEVIIQQEREKPYERY